MMSLSRLIIDFAALRHNVRRIKQLVPDNKIIAILKTNAYGHGAVPIAKALTEVDAFGVSNLAEGLELIDSGIQQPVILMHGFYQIKELSAISEAGLEVVIHNEQQLEMLAVVQPLSLARIWLEIDTGLHRLGIPAERFPQIWPTLQGYRCAHPPAVMTHLATANMLDSPMIKQQLELFAQLTDGLDCDKSVANSAAIIAHPVAHHKWVRAGIMLYGVSPFADSCGLDLDLKPVMTLQSQLISVRDLAAGEPVGYGAHWRCPEDMRIGIVAIGYGHGFPYHAKIGTPVRVNGQTARLIAQPFMDMLAIDLRTVEATVGDNVTLWGTDLPVEHVASYIETIPYDLLCGVQHKRLQKIEYD